jgi:two-component system chemotaxis sensor kinase CheA
LGIRVDEVLDVQEIVVKPLNPSMAHLKVFTGQTILGDGSVVLILDPSGIASKLGIEKSAEKRDAAKETHGLIEQTRLVLFRAGEGLPKVLPLSLLARIEMVEPERIEHSDGRYVMLHQGRLMPLLPTSPMQEIGSKAHPVLVITANEHTIGLLVDEIIDILEERLDIQLPSYADDVVGSAEIRGEAVELIDVTYYLQAAFSSIYQQETKDVLLVDGDLFFRETLKPVLTGAGYELTTANTAAQVYELFEHTQEFKAILVDAEMTDNEGQNVAQYIREKCVSDDMPIIRLYEQPASTVMGLPIDHNMTVNVSKLDRQTLVNTLSSIFATQEQQESSQHSSREMAA